MEIWILRPRMQLSESALRCCFSCVSNQVRLASLLLPVCTATQLNTLSRTVFCTSECSQHNFRCEVLANFFLSLDFSFGSSCLVVIRPCRETTELFWPDFLEGSHILAERLSNHFQSTFCDSLKLPNRFFYNII